MYVVFLAILEVISGQSHGDGKVMAMAIGHGIYNIDDWRKSQCLVPT